MLEEIKKIGWERLTVWFIYVSAQFLVLASLLLTTTSIAVHAIFLIFSLVFYFITAFREPGFFIGIPEPNHEDVQISTGIKQGQRKKRISYQPCTQEVRATNHQSEEWNRPIKINQQPERQQEERQPKIPTKSLKVKGETKNNQLMEQRIKKSQTKDEQQNEKQNLPIQGRKSALQGGKFKLFDAAKSMFNGLTNLVKKQDQSKQSNKLKLKGVVSLEDRIVEVDQKTSEHDENKSEKESKKEDQDMVIRVTNEDGNISSNIQSNKQNSAIEKQQFSREHHEVPTAEHKKEQLHLDVPKLQYNSVAMKLNKIKRYCRICEAYQPLRVKHCHSCDRCISSFDHHCPWMANCVGEKNKFFFLLYLLFQTIQVFTIVVDLIRYLAVSEGDNKGSVSILLIIIILLLLALTSLLVFHLYLVIINLTTWELLRWEKVEYLAIFDKKKLISPFDKGKKQNIQIFWENTKLTEQKKWIDEISEDLSKFRVRKTKACKSQIRVVDSERRPFHSLKQIS